MGCPICGSDEVLIGGDGDLTCQGDCGQVISREELELTWTDDDTEYDASYEDDGQPDLQQEYADLYGGEDEY